MLILILGGASSGKSAVAESLAGQLPAPVTYVATLVPDAGDGDLSRRIDAHRNRRPASWTTVDATNDLPHQLCDIEGTVLVDSLGPWVALHQPDDEVTAELVAALQTRHGDTIVVSDEVGLSVHPESEAGRMFRDRIGIVNQRVAEVADHSLLVAAGRVLQTTAVSLEAITRGDT